MNEDDDVDVDSDDGSLDVLTSQKGLSPTVADKDMVAVLPNRDKDLVTGRCATCDSLVRWPRRLSTFRCTVCLMVNDLEPNTTPYDPRPSETHEADRIGPEPVKAFITGRGMPDPQSSVTKD